VSDPLAALTEKERSLVMRPWAWYDDGPGSPYLATVKHGRTYVMGFARKGMNQAQPVFQVREGRKYGVMQTAKEIGPDWPKHPDAALIVKAVNDYDRLLEVEAAAKATGWNETDGKCWCLRSREETGAAGHEPRCARLREALR
jgi:hypothetical protein